MWPKNCTTLPIISRTFFHSSKNKKKKPFSYYSFYNFSPRSNHKFPFCQSILAYSVHFKSIDHREYLASFT